MLVGIWTQRLGQGLESAAKDDSCILGGKFGLTDFRNESEISRAKIHFQFQAEIKKATLWLF